MFKNINNISQCNAKNIIRKKAHVNKNYCVACGACVNVCPMKAIIIEKGKFASIDINKCVGCSKCVVICPASTIEVY